MAPEKNGSSMSSWTRRRPPACRSSRCSSTSCREPDRCDGRRDRGTTSADCRLHQTGAAGALSETIQKIGGYDLLLCGEETTDASTGHVGPGIAGHLDLPQITYVSEVRIINGKVRARRTAEDGTEWWETTMPCLCTVNFGCNKPREPTLTGKIRVERGGVVTHWSCADVGIDPKKVGLFNSPTIVAKVDTVRLPTRAGRIFSGEPKETVRQLLDALIADRVISP